MISNSGTCNNKKEASLQKQVRQAYSERKEIGKNLVNIKFRICRRANERLAALLMKETI